MPHRILDFWFKQTSPQQWWSVDAAFDAKMREIHEATLILAAQGEFYTWRETPQGRLAEIIVLDQFSRNIYRGTPQAFAQDPMALALAQEAVAADALQELSEPIERAFLLMPYMHSESALIHVEAERLFKAWTPSDNYHFELRHKEIIDRFGRYPHRNKILGRTSSAEEEAFLLQPGSSF